MNDYAEGSHPTRLADHLWLLAILVGVAALYLGSAGAWGLWEPWETEYARMGRALANSGVWMNPTDGDGNPVNKPWLTALLLEWGYRLSREPSLLLRAPFDALFLLLAVPLYGLFRGRLTRLLALGLALSVGAAAIIAAHSVTFSTEFWLRAPFAELGLLTVLTTYALLRQYVGPHRAAACAIVLATSPLFLLSSVSLAGAMPAMATTTIALAAFFLGVTSGRARWWVLAGAATGLAVWADGLGGATVVVGTIAAFGVWSLSRNPRALLAPAPIATIAAVALLTLGYPLTYWLSEGFDSSKQILGAFGPLGIAFTLAAAGLFSGAFRRVGWRGAIGFTVAMAIPVAILISQIRAYRGDDDLFSFLLYNDFLSRRTLSAHVNFDTLIRQLGFSAYPYTIFFPLGLAYLFQTIQPEGTDPAARASDDRHHGSVTALKSFAVCWFTVALLVIGLSATLSGQYIFHAMVPIAVAVALLLTDAGYWRGLRENRTALYLVGFGCLVVLLVLTKDLKTVANPDMGQIGPEVLFEFMLIDGRVAFPDTFSLSRVGLFRAIFALGIALYFFMLLSWLYGLPDRLDELTHKRPRVSRDAPLFRRLLAYLFYPARWLGYLVGRAMALVLRPLRGIIGKVRDVVEDPTRFAALAIAGSVVFATVTATAYMPQLSHHLSNRSLIDTYKVVAQPGEVLYRVGSGSRAATNYYLGEDTVVIASGDENPIETLRTVSLLRPFFCQPEGRMFAIVNRDSLPAAYYEVRRQAESTESCDGDRDLFVLDARSNRYVLVSNVLAEGERNRSPIAEHIFETLPDDAIRVQTEYTFDGKIKLIGYRILDEDGQPVTSASTRQIIYIETFFEVMERVPSAREMFIHVDYRNQRINGDHDPVNGMFPLNYWVPGEIVRDRYEMKIDPGSATGDYTVFFGFFSGDNRMQVRPGTGDNRASIGTIHIEGGI